MNRKIKIGILLSIIHASVLFANHANDSVSLMERMRERNTIRSLYFEEYTQNTALRHLRHRFSLSDFKLGYDTKKSKRPFVFQEGDGFNIVSLAASSYLTYTKGKHLWGMATFQKGKKMNIKWNSSSDIMQIYPYFTADTIGGNIDTETYAFLGGYSFDLGGGTLGIETSYRAMQEFRAIDPRPRNIVSDFTLKSGFSHALFSNYTVAAQVHTNIYKQSGSVDFYHELGASSEWLMSGFGKSFSRFGGNQSSVYYKSHAWGGQVGFIPLNGQGFYLSAEYTFRFLERILQSKNQTPINSYSQHFTDIDVGYLHKKGTMQWGVNSEWTYRNRKGKDYVVGNALAGEYKILTKLPMFIWTETGANLSLIVGKDNPSGFSWNVQPKAGFMENKGTNLHPAKRVSDRNNYVELQMNASLSNKKRLYSLSLLSGYENPSSASLEFPKALTEKYVADYLLYTFKENTANRYSLGIKPAVAFLINARLAFDMAAEYNYTRSETGNYAHRFLITTGIRF